MCVVEHVGLGRYGDSLDPFGSEKAFAELNRVLKPGGQLYISVPIGADSRIYFNAHRCFSRAHVLALLPRLQLVEERYIYGKELIAQYEPQRGFGTGLFHFCKASGNAR
jgi:SAM-dependent methyltransferase